MRAPKSGNGALARKPVHFENSLQLFLGRMHHDSPHLAPQKLGKYIIQIWRFESISYRNNTTEIWEIFLPQKKIQQKTSVDFSPIFFLGGRFHRKFRIFLSWYPTRFSLFPRFHRHVQVSKRWKLHTPSWFHRAPASESWLNGSKFGDLQPWEQKSTIFWDIFLLEFQGYIYTCFKKVSPNNLVGYLPWNYLFAPENSGLEKLILLLFCEVAYFQGTNWLFALGRGNHSTYLIYVLILVPTIWSSRGGNYGIGLSRHIFSLLSFPSQ